MEPTAQTNQLLADEDARLSALHQYEILDSGREEAFDRLARLAAAYMSVPIVTIALIDKERVWFKAAWGLNAQESERVGSFCAHTISTEGNLIIEDTLLDARFSRLPQVLRGPKIRFYVGAPLRTASGFTIGSLCLMDRRPRTLSTDQLNTLEDLAEVVVDQMEFRLANIRLREARDNAEAATEAKSSFLANISHELRTPMNSIIGMSHLALQTELSAKQRNHIEKVRISAENLLRILNDILDYSKIESGKLEIESTDFGISDVMDHVANLLELKAEEKAIELSLETDASVPASLNGDPLRLCQVLVNLGGNAIKFTPHGGQVKIHVAAEAAEEQSVVLRCRCSDTGIGMTREQLDRLFQAFAQADTSTTRKYGGSGLGLSICKRLTDLMGGQIWAESEYGVGSTFFFTAVLRQAHSIAPELAPREPMPGDSALSVLVGIRVLVVEDNEFNQELAAELLSSQGVVVTVAANGREAVELVQANRFDAILMDCHMPVMDGYEATMHLRRNGEDLPIIAMTANVSEEDRQKAREAGMDDYVAKPVNLGELFGALLRQVRRNSGRS